MRSNPVLTLVMSIAFLSLTAQAQVDPAQQRPNRGRPPEQQQQANQPAGNQQQRPAQPPEEKSSVGSPGTELEFAL